MPAAAKLAAARATVAAILSLRLGDGFRGSLDDEFRGSLGDEFRGRRPGFCSPLIRGVHSSIFRLMTMLHTFLYAVRSPLP